MTADSKRAAGPSTVSLTEDVQPSAEKPEAVASSVDEPGAATFAAAATEAEPSVPSTWRETNDVASKEDEGLQGNTRSVTGGMGSRSTNSSSEGSNNINSSCSSSTSSSCSGSTSSSCSSTGAPTSSRCVKTGGGDNSNVGVITHAGTDAGSQIRSTFVNSSSGSSEVAGSHKPLNDYGIPTGVESMKALRRHVELLIDREGNSMARSRCGGVCSLCSLPRVWRLLRLVVDPCRMTTFPLSISFVSSCPFSFF